MYICIMHTFISYKLNGYHKLKISYLNRSEIRRTSEWAYKSILYTLFGINFV